MTVKRKCRQWRVDTAIWMDHVDAKKTAAELFMMKPKTVFHVNLSAIKMYLHNHNIKW